MKSQVRTLKAVLGASVVALGLMAGSAMATTITTTSVSLPLGTDTVNITYPAQSATLDSGGNGVLGGEIQLQTNVGTLNAYCVDLFHTISTGSNAYTFNQNALTAGSSYMNGSASSTFTVNQVGLITNLLINGSLQTQNTINSAALQVAIWDVEYGTAATNGTYNVTGGSGFSFSANSGDTNSATVLSTAQTFLNDVTGYQNGSTWVAATWLGNSSRFVQYLTSSSGVQQQIYLATPEPSTIAVFGMGLIGLWAARRRKLI